MSRIDHTDVVARAKQLLVAAGADLAGPFGAWRIVNLTAWLLKDEGAGLLSKTTGNNYNGYGTDIVAYQDGTIVDALIDGGGANTPAWQVQAGQVDPTRWRPPVVDPGLSTDSPGTPAPAPPPNPAEDPDEVLARSIVEALNALRDKLERTATAIDALNTRLDTLKVSGLRVHL